MAAAHGTAGSRARSWRGRGAALAHSPLLLLLVGTGSYAATRTVSGVWELSTSGANSLSFLQPAREIEGIGRAKATPALRGQRSRVGAGEQDTTAVLEKAMGEKKNGHSENELPDDVMERQVVPKSLEFDAEPSAPSAALPWPLWHQPVLSLMPWSSRSHNRQLAKSSISWRPSWRPSRSEGFRP